MHTIRFLGVLLLTAVLLVGVGASPIQALGEMHGSASNPVNPVVRPFFNIWDDDKVNYNTSVVYNSRHNEFLAVWITAQDNYTYDVWGSRITPDGKIIGTFCIATAPGYRLEDADAAYSFEQDRYFVVFEHLFSAIDADLFAVSFRYDGTDFSDWIVVDNELLFQGPPVVVTNTQDDEYLVVYTNYLSDSSTEIAGRRFRASDDAPLEGSRVTIAYGFGQMRGYPDVVYNPVHNNYLVLYNIIQTSPPLSSLAAKIANSSLNVFIREFDVSDMPAFYLSVASGQDEFLAVWSDMNAYTLFARRISFDGTLLGEKFPVSTIPGVASVFVESCSSRLGYWLMWLNSAPGLTELVGGFVPYGADQALLADFPILTQVGLPGNFACTWQGVGLVEVTYNETKQAESDLWGGFVYPHGTFLPLTVR